MATATLSILEAVNALHEQIRANHPEVPEAVIVVGASGKQRKGQIHGHFAPEAWHGDKHEILLSGESLQRGAVATLGTLIHECAHSLAHAKGIQDTSNHGRYHSKKFKVIAESLGIELEQADTIGWSVTSVPESTQEKYQSGIDVLAEALTTWRAPKPDAEPKKPTTKNTVKIHCSCDEGTSVTKKWWAAHEGQITCNDCLEELVADE